ncbi:MAG TPA: Crp/Fnr family transcriptional regulator [Desulfobacteraceae bacterium]|nr:Crp/Fnr family transcriptional regulator [Desulfobacteraceae bacterium]
MDRSIYLQYQEAWDSLFSIGKPRTFNPGEIIYMQGDRDMGLVVLREGQIKNCVYFCSGLEKTVTILEAPAVSGETALIDDGVCLNSAQAVTKADVIIIPSQEALEFLESHPKIMMLLLKSYARKIRGIQLQAESTMFKVQQKLARMLINFRSYGIFCEGNEANLAITHEVLAGFLGATRPKVTEALNAFVDAGYIAKSRGYITIVDHEGLRHLYE